MNKPRTTRKPKKAEKINLNDVDGLEWLSSSKAEHVEWLIRDMLPANCTTIVEGRKATGKSTFLAAVAACFTGGPAIPGWEGSTIGGVVWLAREDPWASVVKPRLQTAGANTERIGRLQIGQGKGSKRLPTFPHEIALIEEKMLLSGARLLIVDPLPALLGPGADLLSESGCRAIMDVLNEVCDRSKITAILTRHLKKSFTGDVRDAGYGHGAFGNAARAIIRVDNHPYERTLRLVSVAACNWAANPVTQSFEIEPVTEATGAVRWSGKSTLTAQQIAQGDGDEQQRDEWSDAELILAARLKADWATFVELEKEGDNAGVSRHSLRRACVKLGCEKRRVGFGNQGHWEWGPPRQGFPQKLLETLQSMGGHQERAIYATNGQNIEKSDVLPLHSAQEAPLVARPEPPPLSATKETTNGSE